MKKLFLSLATAAIAATAAAQPAAYAPSFLLYADLEFHTHDYGNNGIGSVNRTINWRVAPGIGYQFNAHWVAGINISWGQDASRLHVSASTDSSTTTNNYEVGPFVRYTNSILGSKTFFWFSQLNLNYLGGYTTSESKPSFNKYQGFGAELFPALGINLGNAWCLNFAVGGVGYHTAQNNAVGGITFPTESTFDFTLGQNYVVGVSKNFGGHRHTKATREMGSDTRKIDTSDDDNDAPKKKKSPADDDK